MNIYEPLSCFFSHSSMLMSASAVLKKTVPPSDRLFLCLLKVWNSTSGFAVVVGVETVSLCLWLISLLCRGQPLGLQSSRTPGITLTVLILTVSTLALVWARFIKATTDEPLLGCFPQKACFTYRNSLCVVFYCGQSWYVFCLELVMTLFKVQQWTLCIYS